MPPDNQSPAPIAADNAIEAIPPRTFVLVHGAWHGGWCWRRVQAILAAHGHRVYAPSLTGLGDRAHLFSDDISLQTHVDDVVTLIESEELQDIALIGHSYAGTVISAAADVLRERVAHYIYLDAAVPPTMSPGSSFSWSDCVEPDIRTARLQSVCRHRKGDVLPAPAPSAFAVTEPAHVAWLRRQLRPMPLRTFVGKFRFRNGGSDGMKRTYIASVSPEYVPLIPTHDRIRAEPTWTCTTLAAGHDSMVTAPAELAALLLHLAGGAL